jgi:CheY-like chemotaxis protein
MKHQPLAFVIYEELLPGSQLVNRLQDMGYRVQTITDIEALVEIAQKDKPMIVFADLRARRHNVPAAVGRLKKTPATAHLPIIAFADATDTPLQDAAREAGATLVVHDNVLVSYLAQFMDQALQVD